MRQTLPKWVVRDMSGLPAIPTKDQRSRYVLNVPLRTNAPHHFGAADSDVLSRRDCAADVWIEIRIVLAVRKR